MKITEITFNTTLPKDVLKHTRTYDEYIDDAKALLINNQPVIIGGYRIFYVTFGAGGLRLLVKNPDGEGFLGGLHLTRVYPANVLKSDVELHPSTHGKGVAIGLYKLAILHYKLTISSDSTQTKGSRTLWTRLANDPEIEVYIWDRADKQKPFKDWSPDEDDFDNVYFDEAELHMMYRKRVREINNEINKVYRELEQPSLTNSERGKLNDMYLKLNDELEHEHAQWDETRKNGRAIGSGVVLVATRK